MASEKFEEFVSDPENFGRFLDHIANGGAGPPFCRAHGIGFHYMVRWINADSSRQKQYEISLLARKEWVIESLLGELRSIAFIRVSDLYNADMSLKHPSEWPDHVAGCIKEIEQIEYFEGYGRDKEHVGHIKKLKMHDKIKAIELLGKNLALFVETQRHEIGETLGDLIMRSVAMPPPPNGTLLTGKEALEQSQAKQGNSDAEQ